MQRISDPDHLKTVRTAMAGRVAFVPTMGALHAGHVALVSRANELADHVIVSIFVNPTQFAADEDFDQYPRNLEADCAQLQALGVDIVYTPSVADVYGAQANATPFDAEVATGLETDRRPHFFDGVTSVVRRLFAQVQPNVALFGEKDYQQFCVIRAMVAQEQLGVEIVGIPTLREADGLAMSSRNAYLSEAERLAAPTLHAVITEVATRFATGEMPEKLKAWAFEELLEAGFSDVDYVAIRQGDMLGHVASSSGVSPGIQGNSDSTQRVALDSQRAALRMTGEYRVLAAAWLGKTRLIDNVPITLQRH